MLGLVFMSQLSNRDHGVTATTLETSENTALSSQTHVRQHSRIEHPASMLHMNVLDCGKTLKVDTTCLVNPQASLVTVAAGWRRPHTYSNI